ncbi:MAG: methyl-accepting chemotaxis protein, partial [Wolinella succinogenes]|uniref:methyl-accepting chemotaxis protein n=1 Tax=Wolinella succinogenes TaxID=844 RepID=UPI001690DB91
MSLLNMRIGKKLSLLQGAIILFIMLAFALFTAYHMENSAEKTLQSRLKQNAALVEMLVSTSNKQLTVTANNYYEIFEAELIKYSGEFILHPHESKNIGEVKVPNLTLDGESLVMNFRSVDLFTQKTKATATVFAKSGDDFYRVTTSLKKPDGSRAVGTPLGKTHPAYAKIMAKENYVGKAHLFGRDYMTKYSPILSPKGEVIGILYIGYDFTDALKGIKEELSAIQIGESGYVFAFDPSKDSFEFGLKGESQAKPSSFPYLKELAGKNHGVIEYEDNAGTRIASYQFFPAWGWMLVVTSLKQDFLKESREVEKVLLLSVLVIVLVLMGFINFTVSRVVVSPLNKIEKALLGFFSFLNHESSHAQKIGLKGADEFGVMAGVIDENIERIERNAKMDENFLSDVKAIATEMKEGKFHCHITQEASNPGLLQLKGIFNEVIESIGKNVFRDLNKLYHVLDSFSAQNFSIRYENAMGKVSISVNELGEKIAAILKENLQNSELLDQKAKLLKESMQTLSQGSNEQAASLQQSAAAIEEMSSSMHSVNDRTSEVIKQSEEIKGVIGIIRDIADQ